jgi:small conductance mechanosensitive channel
VLGVDQIKGSEVIYPISVKTLARKQYDALREIQRRIRIALEENNMLPGSPFRVIGGSSTTTPGERPKAPPVADPTTNKPNEINPFAPQ